jgi:hypothetical protein
VDGERELQYLVAWRIHSFFVGRVIWTITQDTPLWPSSTTFEYNSVQSGNPLNWAQELAAKLSNAPMNPYCLIDGGAWVTHRVIASIDNTFRTQHSRPTLGPITLFHRVLDVRSSFAGAE